jgi:hypothetical protein
VPKRDDHRPHEGVPKWHALFYQVF